MALTDKQKRFIDYYIESGNATEAARRAGYKQPNVQGAQNLVKLSVHITERNATLESDRVADMEEINRFWTAIIRGEVEDAEIRDRIKASELRARVQGAFLDRVEISKATSDTIADIEAYIVKRREPT